MELQTILDSYQEIIKQKNAEFAQQFSTKITAFKQDLFIRLQKAAKGETQTFNEGDTHLLTGIKSLADLFNGKLPAVQKTIDLVLGQFDTWTKVMGLATVLGNPFKNPIVVANLSLSTKDIEKIDAKITDIDKWLEKNKQKTDVETQTKRKELSAIRQNLEVIKPILQKGIELNSSLYKMAGELEKLAQKQSDLEQADVLLGNHKEIVAELEKNGLTKAAKSLNQTAKNLGIWLQANRNCKFETEADKQKFVKSIQTMNSQVGNCAFISQDPSFDLATRQKAIQYQTILEKAQEDIAEICGSKINLAFQTKTAEELGKSGGYCAFTIGKDGEPTLLIVSKDDNPGTIAHELCHAAQFKRGEIAYHLQKGKYLPFNCYDLYDEVEAYKVTYAMLLDETNAKHHMEPDKITPDWVKNLSSGHYSNLPNKKLSIDDKIQLFSFTGLFNICKKTDNNIVIRKIDGENYFRVYYKDAEIYYEPTYSNWTMRQYLSATINGVKIIDVVSSVLKVQL